MLVEFSQTASYWLDLAESAKREKRTLDALVYARKALGLSKEFDCWFGYADLLNELHQYEKSATICLQYGQNMDEEQQLDWAELMADNASMTGNIDDYLHYQMMVLRLSGLQDESKDIDDMLSEFFEQMSTEEPRPKLLLSTEAHKIQNRLVYDKMYQSFRASDYEEVLRLADQMHPDYPFYTESLYLKGMSLVRMGDVEEGKRCLWQMYGLTNHDARVLYYLDEIEDGLADEEMERALAALGEDDSKDNMAVACICAAKHDLKKTALFYAERAAALAPDEPEHVFRLAAAEANVGLYEKSWEAVRRVVNAYGDFLPAAFLRFAFRPPVDLSFAEVPYQFIEDLGRYVEKQLEGEYLPILMQTDATFRQSVRFILTKPPQDPVHQSRLAKGVSEWTTPEGIRYQRDLLATPDLPREVQYRLMLGLIENVRKGKVRIANGYLIETYQLKVPPSFDDYADSLKHLYAHAYCEMMRLSTHSELRLSRLTEKLYLNMEEGFYQSDLMGFALVMAGRVYDVRPEVEEILRARGWDEAQYAQYLDIVRKAIKND